jgi:hypothetical protein
MSKNQIIHEPINVSIAEAVHISGLSRSEVYRRLGAGDLEAVKSGKRTLITMDSLRRHLGNLPKAKFRTNSLAPHASAK